MATWSERLAQLAGDAEERLDSLKRRLDQRFDRDEPLCLAAYRGYGTRQRVYVKGRVLESRALSSAEEHDSVWENVLNMYRRFESDELPGARVLVRCGGAEQELLSDEEGYFAGWIDLPAPLPPEQHWHEVELKLLEPLTAGQPPVRGALQVLVPPADASFGVISDIDDTVLQTDVPNALRMVRNVFLGNARTRLPFAGVAAFYRALRAGPTASSANPIFYVSSSPYNLYDLLVDFFELRQIPAGPLFLRDWGLSGQAAEGNRHRSHKLKAISEILQIYPELPFVLIGDSGQKDPEIYHEVVSLYPRRIMAVYIRNVTRKPERAEAIRAMAADVLAAGSTLVLGQDTLTPARHAAEQGWIAPELLAEIEADRQTDAAPHSALGAL